MRETERHHVSLFGTVVVRWQGERTELTRKPAQVLTAIGATRDGMTVEQLVDIVWGEDPPSTWQAALRGLVAAARRPFGDDGKDAIGNRPAGGWYLRHDLVHTDAALLSELVDQAANTTRPPEELLERLCALLPQVTGEPLAGCSESVHAMPVAEDLRLLRARAVALAGNLAIELGQPTMAIALTQSYFARDLLDERLAETLARMHLATGDTVRAGVVVRQHHNAVASELGAPPSEKLLGLVSQHTPSPRLRVDRPQGPRLPMPQPLRAVPTSPLVGRDDVLNRLVAACDSHEAGLSFVTVTGTAGIGKTRIVEELARRQWDHRNLLFGAASHDGRPHSAFRTMTESMIEAGAPNSVTELIAEHLPVLAPGLADDKGSEPAHQSAQRRLERLHEDVCSLLVACAPVLVVIDDIHWLDPASVSLLMSVTDQLENEPVTIVSTVRADQPIEPTIQRALDNRSRNRRWTDVALLPLDADATRRLADAHAPPGRVTPDFIHRLTGGRPLLTVELARSGFDIDIADPSAPLNAFTRERVAAIGAEGQTMLEIAAVLGDRFDLSDLLACSELDFGAAIDLFDRCAETDLLAADSKDRGQFCHVVTRDVILAGLTPLRRARIHANVLRALPDSDPVTLARHAIEASAIIPTDELSRLLLAGARSSRDTLAFDQSVAFFEEAAFGTARQALNDSEWVSLLAEYARTVAHTDETRTGELIRAAVPAALVSRDPQLVLELADAHLGRNMEPPAEFIQLLEASLAWPADDPVRARLMASLSTHVVEQDPSPRPLDLAEQALDLAERSRDDHALAAAHRARLASGTFTLPLMDLDRSVTAVVDLAQQMKDLDLEMIGMVNRVVLDLIMRDYDSAWADLDAFESLAEDRAWPRYQAFGLAIRAGMEMEANNLNRFVELNQRAESVALRCRFPDIALMSQGHQVCMRWHQGRLSSMVDGLSELRPLLPGHPIVNSALGCALAEAGRIAEAKSIMMSADVILGPRGVLYSSGLALAASCAMTTGDRALGAALVAPLRSLTGRNIVAGAAIGLFGPAEGFLGRALVAAGDPEAGRAELLKAHSTARTLGTDLVVSRIETDLASIGAD